MKLEGMYLSVAKEGLTLIYQGLPLCNYKTRMDEIYLDLKMYKQELPEVCWNGDRGEWVTTSTIEELIA